MCCCCRCWVWSIAKLAEEKANSTLPRSVARIVQGVTLTAEQQASFQALRHEFEAKLIDARKQVAAHELAEWRFGAIEREWGERVNAILTLKQKQARLTLLLQSPTQIEFVETPLRDVVDYLRDLHPFVPLGVDRAALRKAKEDLDIPITRNLRSITLDSALRLLLGQVGLMHVIQDESVLITTEEEGHRLLQHGAVDPAAFPSPAKDAAMKKLAEAIRLRGNVQLEDTPLKDVLDYLRDLFRVEIQIDNRAGCGGCFGQHPCTLDLKGVSLDSALKQVLDKVGLKYKLQDEAILVTADPPAKPGPAKAAANKPEPAGLPVRIPMNRRSWTAWSFSAFPVLTSTTRVESGRFGSVRSRTAMKSSHS